MSTSEPTTEPQAAAASSWRESLQLLAVRVLNYLTNHFVAHIPSYAVRHLWYRRVLGVALSPDAAIHLGCYVWFYGPGSVRRVGARVGRRSRINRDCTIDLRGGLTIGDDVSVSAEVTILTSAGMTNSRSVGAGKPVVIEDHAWVGVRAMIMPGVTVGRGAVVSAGAVVVSDVPPLAVVFGSPARPVGKRSPEEAEYVLGDRLPLFE